MRRRLWRASAGHLGFAAVIAALLAVFAVQSDTFLTTRTLSGIANRIPDLTLVSVGMTWVLITGGIDLSVGSLDRKSVV